MKIKNIDAVEEWITHRTSKITANLSIEITDEDELEKIWTIYKNKTSCYVLTDKELEKIYENDSNEMTDKEKIDYLVEKLSKVLGTKARKKDKN